MGFREANGTFLSEKSAYGTSAAEMVLFSPKTALRTLDRYKERSTVTTYIVRFIDLVSAVFTKKPLHVTIRVAIPWE